MGLQLLCSSYMARTESQGSCSAVLAYFGLRSCGELRKPSPLMPLQRPQLLKRSWGQGSPWESKGPRQVWFLQPINLGNAEQLMDCSRNLFTHPHFIKIQRSVREIKEASSGDIMCDYYLQPWTSLMAFSTYFQLYNRSLVPQWIKKKKKAQVIEGTRERKISVWKY